MAAPLPMEFTKHVLRRHCALQQQCEHAEQNKDGRRKGRRAQGKKLTSCRRCHKDFCSRACLHKHVSLPNFDCPGDGEEHETSSGNNISAAAFASAMSHGFGVPPGITMGGPGRMAADASAVGGGDWLHQSLQVLWTCHHNLTQLLPDQLKAAGLLHGLGFVAQALIMQNHAMLLSQAGGDAMAVPLPGVPSPLGMSLPTTSTSALHDAAAATAGGMQHPDPTAPSSLPGGMPHDGADAGGALNMPQVHHHIDESSDAMAQQQQQHTGLPSTSYGVVGGVVAEGAVGDGMDLGGEACKVESGVSYPVASLTGEPSSSLVLQHHLDMQQHQHGAMDSNMVAAALAAALGDPNGAMMAAVAAAATAAASQMGSHGTV